MLWHMSEFPPFSGWTILSCHGYTLGTLVNLHLSSGAACLAGYCPCLPETMSSRRQDLITHALC